MQAFTIKERKEGKFQCPWTRFVSKSFDNTTLQANNVIFIILPFKFICMMSLKRLTLVFGALTRPQISRKAASGGHPQLNVWVLVHHHQGGLSVHCWPLHHHIVFPTGQVEVQPGVFPRVISVTGPRYDTDPVTVAFRAVEARAVNNCVGVSRFHDLGEVLDPPHCVGAAGLRQADVIDEDATSGSRRITAHGLERVAEFHPYLHRDVGDLPCVVSIR